MNMRASLKNHQGKRIVLLFRSVIICLSVLLVVSLVGSKLCLEGFCMQCPLCLSSKYDMDTMSLPTADIVHNDNVIYYLHAEQTEIMPFKFIENFSGRAPPV